MTEEDKDYPLTEQERAAYSALRGERQPPASLEARTVQTLRTRGLLRPTAPASRVRFPALAVGIASIACLAFGFALGKWQTAPPDAHPAGSLFVLFLYGAEAPPADEPGRVEEYSRWARGIRASGHLAGGEKLKDDARILRSLEGRLRIVDAPRVDREGALGGYFVIEAASYDEAVKIASDCPHLKHGGLIEVRQIDSI